MAVGRIFLLESPNALDLLNGTGETTSLSQVCRLFGHEIVSFLIRDEKELSQALMYISSVGWGNETGDVPIFIHLSAHGSDAGLAVGPDEVSWPRLAELVVKTFKGIYGQGNLYEGPIVLVVSACDTKGMTLVSHLHTAYQEGKLYFPPEYVFVFEDKAISWRDAVVTWTMFYKEAPEIDFDAAGEKTSAKGVKKLLKRVRQSGYGNLRYFRWDPEDELYRTYAARK